MSEPVGIGSPVWVFDPNSRAYGADRRLVYRAHWVECRIVGETTRSWVLSYYGKLPKKADERGRRLISQGGNSPLLGVLTIAEVDADCFLNVQRGRIADKIREISDVSALRKVAELIGYEVNANTTGETA